MKASDLQVGDILRYCNTFYRVRSVDVDKATFFSYDLDGGNGRVVTFLIAMLQEPDEILRAVKPRSDIRVGDMVKLLQGPKLYKVIGYLPDKNEWRVTDDLHTFSFNAKNISRATIEEVIANRHTEPTSPPCGAASGAGFGLFATRNDARAANEATEPTPAFKVGDTVRCGEGPKMTVEYVSDDKLTCLWWVGSSSRSDSELRRGTFTTATIRATLPG